MECLKVIKIDDNAIYFDNGMQLLSTHDSDCCEWHYLSFEDLTIEDFNGLTFNLSKDDFFDRINGYGIALKPIHGFPVRIAGYGENNGYYSENLSLVISYNNNIIKQYDITDCQNISDL